MRSEYTYPKSYLPIIAAIAVAVVFLAACGGSTDPTATTSTPGSTPASSPSTTGGKLRVVATTLQIRSMAEAVAGDRAEVRSIMPPGADAHDFEPKPSDVQGIRESAIVLKNGIGLDDWADKLIENAGGQNAVVTVTEGIPLREGASGTSTASEEANTAEEHDPHVWLDVTNAITMTRNIREALIEVDPAGDATYKANAESYLVKLTELDNYIKGQIANIPEGNRKMVTNHDAFGYFIERYGLQFAGSIIPSMSTEARPSAGEVAALINKIKAEKVKAIFLESSINPQLATQIANDAGVKVVDNLYADSMGAPGSPTGSYEGMMRHNAETIGDALK
jgi:zinc/manganese transport system substrate-binding protein